MQTSQVSSTEERKKEGTYSSLHCGRGPVVTKSTGQCESARRLRRESTSESHSRTSFAPFAAANKLPFVAEPHSCLSLSLLPRPHLHTMPSAFASLLRDSTKHALDVSQPGDLSKEACAGILNCKYHSIAVGGGGIFLGM